MNAFHQRLCAGDRLSVLVAVTCAAVLVLLATPLQAQTCSVPGTYGSIQAAVDDMTCGPIELAAQVYSEAVVITRSVTINGNGAVIDGGSAVRPLTVDGGGTGGIAVVLDNMTLSNGRATNAPRLGGGLLVFGDSSGSAAVTASGLAVIDNVASTTVLSGFGGGISVDDYGSLTISHSTIAGNIANNRTSASGTGNGSGGGVYVAGTNATLDMRYCQIAGNTAANNPAAIGAGGGLRAGDGSNVTLTNNTWTGNVARVDGSHNGTSTSIPCDGGAIAVVISSGEAILHATHDRFFGNTADQSDADLNNFEYPRGGAISLLSSQTSAKITATFDRVTIASNNAKGGTGAGEGRGGGIHARGATLIVRNATITDNYADSAMVATDDGNGGGIYVREPADHGSSDLDWVEITNSVIADNVACDGADPTCGTGSQVFLDFTNGPQNSAALTHVTLASETLNPRTALHFNGPTVGDRLLVLNSIVANHNVGINNVNATGYGRGRYILYSGNITDKTGAAFPGNDPTTNVVGDPDFVSPGDRDYHIGSLSAAINLGRYEDVEVASVNFPYQATLDRDGVPRASTPGAAVDSGAYEYSMDGIFADGFESGDTLGWDVP